MAHDPVNGLCKVLVPFEIRRKECVECSHAYNHLYNNSIIKCSFDIFVQARAHKYVSAHRQVKMRPSL